MKNKGMLILGALLGIALTGCFKAKPFEPDAEAIEKINALNETGKIEIDGVEYCKVDGISTDTSGDSFYSFGPLGQDLYGHKQYYDFYEIPNNLGYTVLKTHYSNNIVYVESSKRTEFLNKFNDSLNAWLCTYQDPTNPYVEKSYRLDNDKYELLNSKYDEIKDNLSTSNLEEKETIYTESKEHTIYNFCRYTDDESLGLSESHFNILKVEDQIHLIINFTDNVNDFVCYKGNEEFNNFLCSFFD